MFHSLRNMPKGRVYRCDLDGYLSSTIIYTFLKSIYQKPAVLMHTGKQHGLRKSEDENIVEAILNSNFTLVIIPDAGTNDYSEHEFLVKNDIDVIVLDHHEIKDYDKMLESPAYIVNHHRNEQLNTFLSGTGVTYKFVQAFCEKYDYKMPEYRDLVMFSLISDECNLTSYENYSFLKAGYKVLNSGKGNKFMKFLADKVSKQENHAKKISFRIVPMFNSVCRSNDMQAKYDLFNALVGELAPEEGLKVGNKAHREQRKIIEEIVEEVRPTIDFSKKVLVGFTEPKYKTYIGLAANKFAGEYNKPTFILREASPTKWSGSMRSPIPLAHLVNETELAECLGHKSAAGCFLKKSNLPRLEDWFETLDLNVETVYQVTGELKPRQVNRKLCEICRETNPQWGYSKENKITVPKFYFNITLSKNKIQIIGKKKDTLKIAIGDVNFIRFRLTEEEIEQLNKYDKFNFECIGTLTNNEYNDIITPQVIVERFEVTEYVDNWEDYF